MFRNLQTASKNIGNLYHLPLFYFFDGLVSLAFARNGVDQGRHLKNVEENIVKLKCLCDNAPQNYQNKVCLLEAELAAVRKNQLDATLQYQLAISLSNKNGFLSEEAISLERAGIYYLEINSHIKARDLFLKCYKCYQVWGASLKLCQLLEKYPFILAELNKSSNQSVNHHRDAIGIDTGLEDNVSLLTDDLSQTSLERLDKKRIRLSFGE